MASTTILSDNGASSGSAGLKQTAGNDGVLILQTTTSGGTATNAIYVDTSQNVGLGVTPSAWGSGRGVLQLKNNTSLTDSSGAGIWGYNWYNDGASNKYITSDYASRLIQSGGGFQWAIAPSGTAGNAITFTQAMTLDASGNLGVGTTSPGTRVHAVGGNIWSSNFYEVARFQKTGPNVGVSLGYDNTSYTAAIGAYSHDGTASNLSFWNYPGSGVALERMRIDSSGNLLVGTTNTTFSSGGIRLYANNSIESVRDGGATQANVYLNKLNNNGDILSFNRAGTQVGVVSVTTTATTYGTSSDYRLKENVQPMTGALTKVAALKPVTYTWKADGSDGEGFIAHELQEVCPHAVTGEKDAVDTDGNPVYQGIDTSFLVATLTAAIQELKAELDTAKEQIAILQGAQQ